MTLKQFTELKEMLDKFNIFYEDGNYYQNDLIVGHWLVIKEISFETDELSAEDNEYNNY